MNRIGWRMIMAAALLGVGLAADTQTWNAATGGWFEAANWISGGTARVPTNGDDVVISAAGAQVSLAAPSAFLGSLTISDASLVMSNWDTLLSVTSVTVSSGGLLTCAGPFANNAVSNRVNLLCTNLLVETGGAIDVSGKGWAGGVTLVSGAYQRGNGPGNADFGLAESFDL